MDLTQIPIWVCIFTLPFTIIPKNTFLLWSKTKLDGEKKVYARKHILWFISICINHSITNEGVLCRLISFSFKGKVENLLKSLLSKSIHNSKQFKNQFYKDFENYNYDELCGEL